MLFVVVVLLLQQLALIDGRGKVFLPYRNYFRRMLPFSLVLPDDQIGRIEGNRLINDRFHLSIEMPTNWTILSKKNVDEIIGLFVTDKFGDPVIGIAHHPVFSTDAFPNIIAMITKRKEEENLCSPLDHVRELATQGHDEMKYEKCREVIINGRTFARHEFSIELGLAKRLTFVQYNYLTKDEHFITFTLMCLEIEERKVLDDVMRSLSFSL